MRNFIKSGKVLDFKNSSGSTIPAGKIVVVGTKIGVAASNIADGSTGSIVVRGVFSYAKKAGDTPAPGAALYYDATHDYLTTTATDNSAAGYVAQPVAAASGDATVQVQLNG